MEPQISAVIGYKTPTGLRIRWRVRALAAGRRLRLGLRAVGVVGGRTRGWHMNGYFAESGVVGLTRRWVVGLVGWPVPDYVEGDVDRPGKSGGYYVCELLLILPGSSAL